MNLKMKFLSKYKNEIELAVLALLNIFIFVMVVWVFIGIFDNESSKQIPKRTRDAILEDLHKHHEA